MWKQSNNVMKTSAKIQNYKSENVLLKTSFFPKILLFTYSHFKVVMLPSTFTFIPFLAYYFIKTRWQDIAFLKLLLHLVSTSNFTLIKLNSNTDIAAIRGYFFDCSSRTLCCIETKFALILMQGMVNNSKLFLILIGKTEN